MPIISTIITIAKILVLYSIIKEQKEHIVKIIGIGFSKYNTKDLALGYFNLVKEIASKFIILTNYSSRLSLID